MLPNAQGDLIAVPNNASLEGYLKFLEQGGSAPAERPQAVSVTSIDLNGENVGDSVVLQAKISVEVTGTSSAVLFPLGLTEAFLREEVKVRSTGTATFYHKDSERGYLWWLNGAGVYEFDLKLALPVRKQTPWRRLQLSLPASPVTSLRLRLPTADAPIKVVPDEVVWDKSAQEDGRTEVRVFGFGTHLDVAWQPLPTTGNQPASLDAKTTILVRGAADGLFLEATQTVQALRGVFREVVVRLPDHSELLQVDGPEIIEATSDPEQPDRVTVMLGSSTAGPVTLRWRVRMAHTGSKRIELNGFLVEAAKRQAGTVGLVEVEDARWSVVEAGDQHLERMSAGEFRLSNNVPVVRAYRFYAQPFRLPLTLESVDAYYDVEPVLGLYAAEDEVRLEGRFHVHTFRGKVNQLSLLWPGWRTDGWVLEAIEPRGSVVTGFTSEAEGTEGRIQINLSDQIPERFDVRFSARRARRSGEETRLTLPLLERPANSTAVGETAVVVFAAVNVDAELTPRNETAMRRLPPVEAPPSSAFALEPGLRAQAYRLQTEERQFVLRVTPQPQRVRVSTVTKARWTSRRLDVRQTINHQVDYARLNDAAIIVPAAIADRVNFYFGDTELVPEWSEGSVPQDRIAWLTLPGGRLGTVAIHLEWSQPLPDPWVSDRPVTMTIPLARSEFAASEQSTLEVTRPAWFALSTGDPHWLVQHADDDLVRWQTAAEVREFPLVVEMAPRTSGAPFHVNRAVILAELDGAGGQDYRFQARLIGHGPELSLHLPAKSSPPDVWWDDRPLASQNLVELPAGSRHYSVRLPEDAEPSAEHVLTVDYHLAAGKPLQSSAALVAAAPQLPQCEWSAQVIWEVHLPPDQHLWMPPDAAAPLYRWQRDGWYWRRMWTSNGEELHAWLQGELKAPPPGLPSQEGHTYAFRQLGAAQELRFRTLSTPMTLLCGAGLSIAIGFLALRFTWLRSVVVVMCALCVLAVVALWYLPELELLFQPMALGAVFPILIALAELWSRRRALQTAWTLSASVSDYRMGSAEMPPTQALQPAHADSPTIFRAPLAGEQNSSRMPAESHAG